MNPVSPVGDGPCGHLLFSVMSHSLIFLNNVGCQSTSDLLVTAYGNWKATASGFQFSSVTTSIILQKTFFHSCLAILQASR